MKPLGVILAGGQGRRMGGSDKALMTFRGRPLIEHVIDGLAPQVSQIILNINRNHAQFNQYGYPLISDTQDQYQGPLIGMMSVLEALVSNENHKQFEQYRNANGQFDLVVVPCDSPFIPSNLCSQLQQAKHRYTIKHNAVVDNGSNNGCNNGGNNGVTEPAIIAHDGSRLQPLFILLSTYHLPELQAFINSGNRKVLDWIALVNPIISEFKNSESLFRNINTLKDLHSNEKSSK